MATNHTQVVCSQKQRFYHSSCRETSKKHLWEHLLFIALLHRTVCSSNVCHLDVLKLKWRKVAGLNFALCLSLQQILSCSAAHYKFHPAQYLIGLTAVPICTCCFSKNTLFTSIQNFILSNGKMGESLQNENWPWRSLCCAHLLALKMRIAEQPILCFEQILYLKITCDVSLYFIHHKYYQN